MFGKRGRTTFKSKDYLDFQHLCREELVGIDWPFGKEKVQFVVEAAFSNKAADLDNCLKPLLDTFQSMYEEFDDKMVYGIIANKNLVKRGEEYLDITIERVFDEDELQ